MDDARRLSPLTRWLWLAALLALGLLPSLAFFVWVERNLALPPAWTPYEWPWIRLGDAGFWTQNLFNAGLFVVFGLFHSWLAQPRVQAGLRAVLPPQTIRAFYLGVSGQLLVALMGCWQHTGRLVWVAPLPQAQAYALSAALFLGFMALAGRSMSRFNGLEFVGLWQLFQRRRELDAQPAAGTRLYRDGIYARVRHPIYLFTSLAFVVTPVMTWDRLWLSAVMLAYLAAAIPVEEKKLVALFGDAYRDYRSQVPALIPFWRPRPKSS